MQLFGIKSSFGSPITLGKDTNNSGRYHLSIVAAAWGQGRQTASSEHGKHGRRKADGGRQRWSDSDVDFLNISGLETQGRDPQLGPQDEAKATQQARSAASGQELLMSQYIKSCTGWEELREVR